MQLNKKSHGKVIKKIVHSRQTDVICLLQLKGRDNTRFSSVILSVVISRSVSPEAWKLGVELAVRGLLLHKDICCILKPLQWVQLPNMLDVSSTFATHACVSWLCQANYALFFSWLERHVGKIYTLSALVVQ